jgi:DNA-binding CsgD family transcriptional regulator
MRVSDFIEAINRAQTLDDVCGIYCRTLAELGYDRVMYSVLVKGGSRRDVPSPAIMRNYPDDWVRYYVAKGYVERDPVRRACIRARGPLTWNELATAPQFPKSDLKIFPEAKEAGLHDGVAVPLHGPGGEVLGVGLASSAGGTDAKRLLGHLNVLSVQFHIAYSALAFPEETYEGIRLTPREREILQWCLQGKSSWAIGEILQLSEKTVEWHLSRAYSKLSVSGRIPAVVKALSLGLISQ